jgi:hypothetical protein
MPLIPRTVADFHHELFALLASIGIEVDISLHPVESPVTTPFTEDMEHAAYDAAAAHRFGQVLRSVEPIFEVFRAHFRGKGSPVHFFWGSFDLAVTRFSGKRAPLRKGSIIERDAYDEEVISLGFWPGDAWNPSGPDALFYAYAVPEPPGFAGRSVRPAAASYSAQLKEFVLPYDAVRREADPVRAVLEFAESTYESGATLAAWPREALAYP